MSPSYALGTEAPTCPDGCVTHTALAVGHAIITRETTYLEVTVEPGQGSAAQCHSWMACVILGASVPSSVKGGQSQSLSNGTLREIGEVTDSSQPVAELRLCQCSRGDHGVRIGCLGWSHQAKSLGCPHSLESSGPGLLLSPCLKAGHRAGASQWPVIRI